MNLLKKRKKSLPPFKIPKIFRPGTSRYLVLTMLTILKMLLILFLTAFVYFVFSADFFKINNIFCESNGNPCTQSEKSLFLDLKGENIFRLNIPKITNSMTVNYPNLLTIDIKRELPNKARVKINKRQEFACIKINDQNWFLIDENGFIFDKTSKKNNSLPEIIFQKTPDSLKIGMRLEQEEVKASLKILQELKKNYLALEKIYLENEQKITLFLDDDVIASLSGRKDLTLQVDSLQFILRQSKIEGKIPSMIDLRFIKPVVVF